MENALLIGLSRQMALQHQMDVVANNIANLETPGYKGETLKFEEYIQPAAESEDLTRPTEDVSYVLDARVIRNFVAGQMKQTGNPLDVAINGSGWFAIEAPSGELYTRDGHFTLNEEGTMVTAEGHPVLGESGTISFSPEETGIAIATDGTISSSAGEKGKLRVVEFEDEAQLLKEGSNMFSAPAPGLDIETPRVAQGFIENSNVNAVSEMARMIEVSRSYVSTARALDKLADLKSQAINDLADMQV
jgi:flagellar basal-body rod protein FlgF